MVNRRDIGSWISGPRESLTAAGVEFGYRGERLGLPETGPGSLAGLGRRFVAIAIDWAASLLVVRLLFAELTYGSPAYGMATLAIFGFEIFVLTWMSGASFGQRLLSIQIRRLDQLAVASGSGTDGPVAGIGLAAAAFRTILLCLLIPALIWDRDGRGLHDKAAGTACVRT